MFKLLVLSAFLITFSSKVYSDVNVVNNYVNIAYAKYNDSLNTAKDLLVSINLFLEKPNEKTHADAKATWLKSRVPYQQTEVYRFGNEIVDNWEGKVNSWPLDEGMIDYVDATYISGENDYAVLNIIANPILKIDGNIIDSTIITKELLTNSLHELSGNEANVATGYHAIEFLLWGQDLNGSGPGAGKRSFNDYSLTNCKNNNCDRRRMYLKVVTELLVYDLEEIVEAWGPNGEARKKIENEQLSNAIKIIITGMGSLSYGELAGERMKLGLMLHDPEEEHDCFSDNTHNSHYYNALGIQNTYLGRYITSDGSKVSGSSLSSLVADKDKELDKRMKSALKNTMTKMAIINNMAENGQSYDQLISEGNIKGNKIIQEAINSLINQTKYIEEVAIALNLNKFSIEGSESLDNPDAIFE